ncbi:uncharacterized protein METZ01_LOCUS309708, partial [marine metagenome]
MNQISTLEKEDIAVEPTTWLVPNQLKSHKPSLGNTIKKWVKKMPFFSAVDYFRRKVYDSSIFDGYIQPLAKVLEEWPGALLIDITNRCNAKCV